jgi:glycosyltransferase involved in cell wall biosynthesis
MKVVVLTTSYPRDESDMSGHFVRDAVDGVRRLGVDVEVVSPASVRHFGIAYGAGIAQNLRREPWKAVFLPGFMASFAVAARRAARDADLVHAHWIPSALAARVSGKPYLLQVWGTDVALAHGAPMLARPLLGGARYVIAASSFLAGEARSLGASRVEVIPPGVAIPKRVGSPAAPPHVLFAGRLSEEKGIVEFLAATEGMPRVIVGDGPLRGRVPDAVGFVPPARMGEYYERAAVVCVPSRREGYGLSAREAMAYGRPVVTTGVGGLADLGVGAIAVEPALLRETIARLLADAEERERLGVAARTTAEAAFSPEVSARALLDVYRSAVSSAP